MSKPHRHPAVAWLLDSDFCAGREAGWTVTDAYGKHMESLWPVKVYDQRSTETVWLHVGATKGNGNDGGVITLSIRQMVATPPTTTWQGVDIDLGWSS